MSEVPDYLELTLVHPFPNPNKDPNVATNLRPISTTPLCKLIECLIHALLQYYLIYTQPWFHPSQTGFRPYLCTHECLQLLSSTCYQSFGKESWPARLRFSHQYPQVIRLSRLNRHSRGISPSVSQQKHSRLGAPLPPKT